MKQLTIVNLKVIWLQELGMLKIKDSNLYLDPGEDKLRFVDKEGREFEVFKHLGDLMIRTSMYSQIVENGEEFTCLTPIPYAHF